MLCWSNWFYNRCDNARDESAAIFSSIGMYHNLHGSIYNQID